MWWCGHENVSNSKSKQKQTEKSWSFFLFSKIFHWLRRSVDCWEKVIDNSAGKSEGVIKMPKFSRRAREEGRSERFKQNEKKRQILLEAFFSCCLRWFLFYKNTVFVDAVAVEKERCAWFFSSFFHWTVLKIVFLIVPVFLWQAIRCDKYHINNARGIMMGHK